MFPSKVPFGLHVSSCLSSLPFWVASVSWNLPLNKNVVNRQAGPVFYFIYLLDVFASYDCPLVYQIAKLSSRFGIKSTSINVVAQIDGSRYAKGKSNLQGYLSGPQRPGPRCHPANARPPWMRHEIWSTHMSTSTRTSICNEQRDKGMRQPQPHHRKQGYDCIFVCVIFHILLNTRDTWQIP